jgi:hypothetical protein
VLNLTDSIVSTFELSGLQPATTYDINVFAVNVKGKSEPFSFSTKTAVPPIELDGMHRFLRELDIKNNNFNDSFSKFFIRNA